MTPCADAAAAEQVLRSGELTVLGRIRSASNATFLCEAELDSVTVHCVYKPVAGSSRCGTSRTAPWPAASTPPT